ncbi:hmg box protein [Diplodia corticola]|uniref:Hmg box protein n=1 Tax=Diplodia corticola TaxID=236234 RepID=A0A1J9RC26_9PEZI|nr:hmg box protein [Diplodia corticola]OJD37714.1 hmg box protein [Diplodia corticola]
MLKAERMVQRHPPTPPSVPVELQYELHHLVQHNANTSYKYELDESQYEHSRAQSTYASPGPLQHPQATGPYMSPQYNVSSYPDPHGQNEVGLGISMDGYGGPGPTFYHDDGQAYHGLPYMAHGMQAHTPPTPRSATESDGGRRTRSGTSAARTASPVAKARPTKSKKKSSEPKVKVKTPKLTLPLSVLTKDYDHIPVKNMEEWVHRSAEQRRAEAAKRNGYITRPMNSFMLYRSAYAERTKIWCLQNNHQVVSSVSGESWPMEPPEVREHYNDLAKIERINHQNAHPDYKFSPSKTTPAARKRKGTYSDDETSERSEVDDPDAEWNPSAAAARRARHHNKALHRRQQPSSFDEHSFGPNNGGVNKSAWEATNGGRPPPAALGMQADMHHQYYQTTVHPHGATPGVEDVRMHRMEHPDILQQQRQQHTMSPVYHNHHHLLGLPGGAAAQAAQQAHHEQQQLLQLGFHHAMVGTPGGESQLDPMLLGLGAASGEPFLGDDGGQQNFGGAYDENSYAAFLSEAPPDHQPAEWQVDASLMPMEPASEFDKWMDEPTTAAPGTN